MENLKDYWDSPMEYVVSLFNTYNTNFFLKTRNCIQYLQCFLKNNTNVPISESLSILFILVSLAKVF